MRAETRAGVFAAGWLALSGCATGEIKVGEDSTAATSGDGPTWYQDVAPVVIPNCTGCHYPGGPSFDLTSPATAQSMAGRMAFMTAEGLMPPWAAEPTETCQPTLPWKDDPRLSAEEIALLAAWSEAGAPLGDPADAAPAEAPVVPTLEDADVTLTPVGSYTSGAAADEFWCFVVDPGLSAPRFLDGVEFVADNGPISHHALIMLDANAESDAVAGADGWYECSGGMGISSTQLLATWVPGAQPFEAAEGAGTYIPANSRIVVQMHYHPSGRSGEVDQPGVRLRWMSGVPARYQLTTLIGNFPTEAYGLMDGPDDPGFPLFFIPAGSPDHTETMRYTVPPVDRDLTITHVGAHMHLVGQGMDVRLNGDDCLLSASRYDYNWQRSYEYDVPVDEMPTVRTGDELQIECRYNNSLSNPALEGALDDAGLTEPVDVWLGEGTLDEMCLAMVGFLY